MKHKKRAGIFILIDFLKNDYRNILPVISSLMKKEVCCKIIATDKKHKGHLLPKIAGENGIPFNFLEDFTNAETSCNLNKTLKIYKAKLKHLHCVSSRAGLFLYNNFSLLNGENNDFSGFIGFKRVKYILKRGFAFKEMLNAERPDLLIFSDEQSALGKFYALFSGSRRIPYLCLPDLGDQLLENLPVYAFTKTSRYVVLGKGPRDFFRRRQGSAKHFMVTGMPLADTFAFTRPQLNREEILKRFGFKKDKGLFLFAMQDSLPENKQILDSLVSLMRLFPNKCLIIRPHPASEHTRTYYSQVKAAGVSNVIVSKSFEISDLINACEIIITVYSLTGFNAIIKDKPLITINLSPFPDNMPYAKYGAALGVYELDGLPQAVESILSNVAIRKKLFNGRKKFLRDYPAYNLNSSKDRIRDLALSCIKKRI
ncbi:MAG: CDP-glycerol glycerophosphotransferase family protein [Candidatus Omnitrophota bacterium]